MISAKSILWGFAAVVLVVMVVVVWPSKRTTDVVAGPSSKHLYEAIHGHIQYTLEGRDVSVTMIIPGQRTGDNLWRFTGSLQEQRVAKPFYGNIKLLCPTYTDYSCWGLESFSVDGAWVPVDSIDGEQKPQAVDQAVEEERQSDLGMREEVETSKVLAKAKAEQPSAKDLKKTPLETEERRAVVDQSGVQFWKTKSDNVNGRQGPSTEAKIAFKMPSHVKLKLVRKEQHWGLFAYDAQGGVTGEIWISMRLVVPYE